MKDANEFFKVSTFKRELYLIYCKLGKNNHKNNFNKNSIEKNPCFIDILRIGLTPRRKID